MGEDYDRLREPVHALGDTENKIPPSESQIAPQCEVCGRQDDSVRLVQYPFVISIVFATFRRAFSGVWCRRHQWPRLLGAGAITALFGWLGIPYGFIYTPVALIQLAKGGICPPEANANLLARIASINLQAGRREIAVKSLINALAFSDTPEIRKRLKDVTSSYFSAERPTATGFGSLVMIWGILAAMILLGFLIGLIDFAFGIFIAEALPYEVNIFVAIFTWAPLLVLGFIGGLLIQVGVQASLRIHQTGHWLSGVLLSLIAPLLALYSIVLGGNFTIFIRDLLSGEVYRSIQEALGYLGPILTVGGYQQLAYFADTENYIWLLIWFIIGVYFFWNGIFAARRHAAKMKLSGSALPSPTTSVGLNLTPLIAIGVFVLGVTAAFILFAQPLGEAAITEETIDHLQLADQFLQQGQLLQARSEFNLALETDPSNDYAYFGKGITYYAYGQYETALESFQQAVELAPEVAEYHTFAGICLVYLERTGEGREYLEAALEIRPDAMTTALTNFGFGLIEIIDQNLEAGINYLEQALALNPDHFETKLYLLLAYLGNLQFQDCVVMAQDLYKSDESWSAPLAIEAICLFHQGEMDASEAALEQALDKASIDLLSMSFEVGSLMNLHRFDEALLIAEEAMESAPTDPLILEPWIMLYAMEGQSEQARQRVEELIAQSPENPKLHEMHSLALAYLGRFDEANVALELALSLGADPAPVYESMSYNYFYQQEYWRAYQSAVRSVQYDDNNAYALIRLAMAALEVGYIEEACQAATTAYSLMPMIDMAHYSLGMCYYESGDQEQARSELELFLELYFYRPNADLHYENAINLLEELDT